MKSAEMAKNLAVICAESVASPISMQIKLENGVKEIMNRKGKSTTRHCPGLRGQKILLLTNYFKVHVENTKRQLYHYDVSFSTYFDFRQETWKLEIISFFSPRFLFTMVMVILFLVQELEESC